MLNIHSYNAHDLAIYCHESGLDLEDLDEKITAAQSRRKYFISRLDMPVIEYHQIKQVQNMLLSMDIEFEHKKISAKRLKPVQNEIYIDKAINSILQHGLSKSRRYLQYLSTITISADNCIIDGHHRWLTAMLINPSMRVNVFQVDKDFTDVYRLMVAYTNILNNSRKD